MTIRFIFAWYDLWIGLYWSAEKRRLYVLPVPMLGFYLQFPRPTASEIEVRERCVTE